MALRGPEEARSLQAQAPSARLGGLIVEQFGWRAALLAMAPAALLLAAFVRQRLPLDEAPGRRPHFDVAGSAALAVALGTLIVLIERGGHGRLSLATFTATATLRNSRRSTVGSAARRASWRKNGMRNMLDANGNEIEERGGEACREREGSRLPATLGMALIAAPPSRSERSEPSYGSRCAAIALMATFTAGVAVARGGGCPARLRDWCRAVGGSSGEDATDVRGLQRGGVGRRARGGQDGRPNGHHHHHRAGAPGAHARPLGGVLWHVVHPRPAGVRLLASSSPVGSGSRGVSGASSGAAGFRPAFVVLALIGVLATVASWLRGPVRGYAGAAVGHLPVQPG